MKINFSNSGKEAKVESNSMIPLKRTERKL